MLTATVKVLMTTSLLMLLIACQSTKSPIIAETSKYHEYIHSGDLSPIKTITTIDGKVIDFQGSKKKKLVILFATWCSDSNSMLKALNSSPLLTDDSLEVIAIAREEDIETVQSWRNGRNIKIPLAVDVDRSIYKQFAAGGIPRIVTVDENNKIVQMNLAEGSEQLAQIVWQ